MWSDNPNCRGCGATLNRSVCAYCGRKADAADLSKIKPDPKADPTLKAEPRKVYF